MENYRMKSSPPILTFHMLSSYSLPGSYCDVSKCALTEFCLCIYLLHIQIFIILIIKLALYYTQYSVFFLKLSNVALRSFHNCIEYFFILFYSYIVFHCIVVPYKWLSWSCTGGCLYCFQYFTITVCNDLPYFYICFTLEQ